jgi:flagellar protein FliS
MIATSHAAKTYSRIGLETGVAAASPQRLIVMLYEGALLAVMEAESHLAAQRAAQKGRAISRAIMIIDEGLKASLDHGRGGSIAIQLHELYDYMGRRLLAANLHNDAEALAEVARLLRELKSAWEAIDGAAGDGAVARTAHATITAVGQADA